MMSINLRARLPFNFHSVVKSHGWVQLAPFGFDEDSSTLTYVDRLASGRVVEYSISGSRDGLQLKTGTLTKAELEEARGKIRWMFALDADFSAFYAASHWEPKLRNAEKLARGRVLRSPTLFEDVVKTILTTNTLWAATKRMNLNLINLFGEPLTGGLDMPRRARGYISTSSMQRSTTATTKTTATTQTKRAFPTPQSIAASSPEEIKEKVRVGYRAPAIHELAVRVASGELDLEALKTSSLPTLELRKELIKIKGVGPYAAANLLLILGRPDFIPIDSWALKLVSNEWYRGKPITAREVEKRFEKWGEFKGFAFWFWEWKEIE
jgi:3-methyladenine DNA glycosylase/8-oxoguanine DNA glycosylase